MSKPNDSANTPQDAQASTSVQETRSLETIPTAAELHENSFPPNTPLAASTTSFILGSLFSLTSWFVLSQSGVISAFYHWDWHKVALNQPLVQVSLFLSAWSFFHWGEFAVTAGWNREKCSTSSFLLDNGKEYHIAHSVALIEFAISVYFFPNSRRWSYITPIGMVLTALGQFIRSIAMIHASTNFSHQVAFRKRRDHELVTTGIYSWSRHPSYAGFFYWGIGTQLMLQNPISFVGYFVALWRFFYRRISYEERALVKFFGTDYEAYRAKTPTRIPFIR